MDGIFIFVLLGVIGGLAVAALWWSLDTIMGLGTFHVGMVVPCMVAGAVIIPLILFVLLAIFDR